MKEIGGYFEVECYGAKTYHANAIALNTGRNALRYAIRVCGIKEIFVPYYTCNAVWNVLCDENCKFTFYDIDNKFMPTIEFPKDGYVLVNDWFGVCGGNIGILENRYDNLIVDNAQSFFAEPKGLCNFYSPRKFFGLPDGGLLVSKKRLEMKLVKDVSYERTAHLLKRHDLGASEGYGDFNVNENTLANLPIMEMSSLTRALMGNIDYRRVQDIRLQNFGYLHGAFSAINELDFDAENIVCPMVYPLLVKKELRKKLIDAKIYVARYWDVGDVVPNDTFSAYLSKYLLPLPIDQRYGAEDMERIIGVIKENL